MLAAVMLMRAHTPKRRGPVHALCAAVLVLWESVLCGTRMISYMQRFIEH